MNMDTLNRGELLEEIMELARERGVASEGEWKEIVDETLESHQSLGEMDDDQDSSGLAEALYGEWGLYQRTSGEESAGAIGEDPEAPHA
jgi:hypothetical protein